MAEEEKRETAGTAPEGASVAPAEQPPAPVEGGPAPVAAGEAARPEPPKPKGPRIPLPSSLQEIVGALLFASESPLSANELRTCVASRRRRARTPR